MSNKLDGNELSKIWFNFCFDNPGLINPNHSAMYFFAIDRCNRYYAGIDIEPDWIVFSKEIVKECTGIKNNKIFDKTFNDLIKWGFFVIVEVAPTMSQYSGRIIRLPKL